MSDVACIAIAMGALLLLSPHSYLVCRDCMTGAGLVLLWALIWKAGASVFSPQIIAFATSDAAYLLQPYLGELTVNWMGALVSLFLAILLHHLVVRVGQGKRDSKNSKQQNLSRQRRVLSSLIGALLMWKIFILNEIDFSEKITPFVSATGVIALVLGYMSLRKAPSRDVS